MSTKNFSSTITTRYGVPEKSTYDKVMEIVKKERIAKSRAQLLLVERGLHHTDNPEPLVKEKVVYRDRPVEKVVEKVVYRDRPAVNKGTQEHIRGADRNSQQGALSAKLTPGDKADPPSSSKGNTALGEKKADTEGSGLGWLVLGAGITGVVLYLWKRYTSYTPV